MVIFSVSMMRVTQRDLLRFLRRSVPAFVVGLSLLCASLLASSPYAHHLVHHDAGSPSHECIATVIVKGEFLVSAASGASAPLPPPELLKADTEAPAWLFIPELTAHGSRAPPQGLSLIAPV